jgi:hypothetical protein
MSLYVLDAVFWILGIRGQVPNDRDLPPRPNRSPPLASSASRLMRVLVAAMVAVAFLSLVLWVAVWLSLKLL